MTHPMSNIWHTERGRQARDKILRMAAEGDDPEIAELAREILGGRIQFRDALVSSAYSEILLSRLEPQMQFWENLSESQLEYARYHADELLGEAISAIEELSDQPARTDRPAPSQPDHTEEDFEQHTYLRHGW